MEGGGEELEGGAEGAGGGGAVEAGAGAGEGGVASYSHFSTSPLFTSCFLLRCPILPAPRRSRSGRGGGRLTFEGDVPRG